MAANSVCLIIDGEYHYHGRRYTETEFKFFCPHVLCINLDDQIDQLNFTDERQTITSKRFSNGKNRKDVWITPEKDCEEWTAKIVIDIERREDYDG